MTTLTTRDTQKSRLYAAEGSIRKAIGDVPFPTKLGLWTFVEKVERDKWFRRRYPHVRNIEIHNGGGRRSAAASTWRMKIYMPRWARTPLITLHEIAHLCAPDEEKHGRRYAAIYLDLVRHFLGKDVHAKLRAAFREKRVRYRPRRAPRVLTDIEREHMRARMATLRAKKQLAAKPREAAQEPRASR